MLIGKEICKTLKEIRKKIADENQIEYNPSQCNFLGECQGTCPKCESELRYIEQELLKRQKANKKIVLAGVAGLTLSSLSSCFGLQMQGDDVGLPPYRDTIEQENDTISQAALQEEFERALKQDGRLMGDVAPYNPEK